MIPQSSSRFKSLNNNKKIQKTKKTKPAITTTKNFNHKKTSTKILPQNLNQNPIIKHLQKKPYK